MIEKSKGYKAFTLLNYIILSVLALLCFLPLLNVLAISFSDRSATAAGAVTFWPVNFTTAAYQYVLQDHLFLSSLLISVFRVFLGGAANLILTLLCAYPLSKEDGQFKARIVYVWIFLFANLFNLYHSQ